MLPHIRKADGSTEEFHPEKLISSLERSGADAARAKEILAEVEKQLYDGATTSEIYRLAFGFLREKHQTAAARYSLKRAVLDFGPSGFPFEAYLAALFRAEGCTAVIDQIVYGACVDHEVDVILTCNGVVTYIEAKFHNSAAFKTDLKTTLYIKARMEDIAAKLGPQVRGMLVTNTKFTSKAVQYAKCADIELLSWDYPQHHSLHERIDAAKVYPITALTSLSKQEKEQLLKSKVVLCSDIVQRKESLAHLGVAKQKAEAVYTEAAGLCIPGNDL